MGSELDTCLRICPVPPGSNKGLNWQLKPRTIFMAAGLITVLSISSLSTYLFLVPPLPEEPPIEITYAVIAIHGNANFRDTALLEGWPGDGSSENPFTIDGLDIDAGGNSRSCISISYTRVSFTISNCNLTGAYWDCECGLCSSDGAGIYLDHVTNGELVNNTCSSNRYGIELRYSCSNTMVNNTCNNNNASGIHLYDESYSNTVANNMCTSNTYEGIFILESDYNTVANNTCTSNTYQGIHLGSSNRNTVENNTCTSNDHGIALYESVSNTVANNMCTSITYEGIHLGNSNSNTVESNTCNNNSWIGINLYESESNTVENNTSSGNTEHGIHTYCSDTIAERVDTITDPVVLLLIGLVGITAMAIVVLEARWRKAYDESRLAEERRREMAFQAGRLAEERRREVAYQAARLAEERRKAFERSYKGDVDVPIGHRLASWLGKRRSIKLVDGDDSLEADASDQ